VVLQKEDKKEERKGKERKRQAYSQEYCSGWFDTETMAYEDPYERIEVRPDGYLWLVNYQYANEGEEHQQPLLLHAASSLLRQLQEKWHDEIVLNNNGDDDDDDDNDHETTPEPMDIDNEQQDGEDLQDDKPDDVVVDREEQDGENRHGNSYQCLKRTTNLMDRILSTLTHVQHYKHDPRRQKRKFEDRREGKVAALQHQRDRLMQQKQQEQLQKLQQNPQPPEGAVGTVVDPTAKGADENKDDGFQVVIKSANKEGDDGSVSSSLAAPQHPHIRLVRTLNSVRALVPVLLRLLSHPDRLHKDLQVGSLKQLPKGNKAKSWLLGNFVFDLASAAQVKSAHSQVRDLLELFVPYRVAKEIVYKPSEDFSTFWNSQWLSHVWVGPDENSNNTAPSPYDVLAGYNPSGITKTNGLDARQEIKSKIIKRCQACDEKLFPKYAGNPDDATLQNQYQKSVHHLHQRISFILEKDFPGSRLSVYGSCLSNLSLKGSDVDLSFYLPQADRAKKSFENGFWTPAKYEKEISKLVRDVFHRLVRRRAEFAEMVPVTRARVPVVKGCFMRANNPYTDDGSLQ
jgi:Nucleotidyltransferase domain